MFIYFVISTFTLFVHFYNACIQLSFQFHMIINVILSSYRLINFSSLIIPKESTCMAVSLVILLDISKKCIRNPCLDVSRICMHVLCKKMFKVVKEGVLEESIELWHFFLSTVFPNVPTQPGMPCQGEDSK